MLDRVSLEELRRLRLELGRLTDRVVDVCRSPAVGTTDVGLLTVAFDHLTLAHSLLGRIDGMYRESVGEGILRKLVAQPWFTASAGEDMDLSPAEAETLARLGWDT